MKLESETKRTTLTLEDLKPIVEGIAGQYSKDLINGTGWSYQKFEELSQELYLKAYTILHDNHEASLDFIAKCLWNAATDYFRSDTKYRTLNVQMYDDRFDTGSDTNVTSEAKDHIVEQAEAEVEQSHEEMEINNYIDQLIKLTEKDEQMKSYIIAKLKIAGLLNNESYPEIDIYKLGLDPRSEEYDAAQEQVLLSKLFGFKNAKTGGPGSFKAKKYKLRLDILSILDLEECYPTYYWVEYIDPAYPTVIKGEWIKACTKLEVEKYYKAKHPNYIVKSIVME